jgi:hypothetical protein
LHESLRSLRNPFFVLRSQLAGAPMYIANYHDHDQREGSHEQENAKDDAAE